ncbi:MAG: hypothetical protein AAB681_00055 [Patescibacteria group bacterium]
MLRSIVAVIILLIATFFLPFWVQAGLYVLALFFVRYKILLLLPAIFADAWYAPTHTLSFSNNKIFLLVLFMLIIYFLVIRNTRITQKYDLEKK